MVRSSFSRVPFHSASITYLPLSFLSSCKKKYQGVITIACFCREVEFFLTIQQKTRLHIPSTCYERTSGLSADTNTTTSDGDRQETPHTLYRHRLQEVSISRLNDRHDSSLRSKDGFVARDEGVSCRRGLCFGKGSQNGRRTCANGTCIGPYIYDRSILMSSCDNRWKRRPVCRDQARDRVQIPCDVRTESLSTSPRNQGRTPVAPVARYALPLHWKPLRD